MTHNHNKTPFHLNFPSKLTGICFLNIIDQTKVIVYFIYV